MTDPPIVADIALLVARRYRAPLVVISQDVFPEIAVELKRLENPVVMGLLRGLVSLYLRRADRIVAIGDTMRRRLRGERRAGGPSARHSELGRHAAAPAACRRTTAGRSNGAISPTSSSSCTRATSATRRISTRSSAPRRSCATSTTCAIMIIGMGARHAELIALAEQLEVDQVTFALLPAAQPCCRSRSPPPTSTSSVSRPGLAGYVVPSRLYGILAVAKPVIVAADPESETAQVVDGGRVAASSFRPVVPSCLRARSAMRTTGSTTSRRWARADVSGWSARPIVPSPSAATATSCSSLRRSYVAAGLIAALALVAGWNTYKYPSGSGYDVRQHREYADLLIHHGEIPGPENAERVLHAAGLLRPRRRGDLHRRARAPRRSPQARPGPELVRAARHRGRALVPRTRAVSAASVGAAVSACVLLLPSGRSASRCDVPPRAAVDALQRGRVAARHAHARPARVRLAARGRDGRRARARPARARFLPLDARGGRACLRRGARLAPAGRDRARRRQS